MSSHRIAFISGPLDATQKYFDQHYARAIDRAIEADDVFIMGPVAGIDALALEHLLRTRISRSRITVFMAHFEYANEEMRRRFEELGVGIKMVGDEGATTRERDQVMTQESDYDILRYRGEEEAKVLYGEGWWPRVSNTEVNERRRRGISSLAYSLDGDDGKEGKGRRSVKERILRVLRL